METSINKQYDELSKPEKRSFLGTGIIMFILKTACLLMLLRHTVILENIIPPLEWILPPLFGLICFCCITLHIFHSRLIILNWSSLYMLLLLILYILCKQSIFLDYHVVYSVFIGILAGIDLVCVFLYLFRLSNLEKQPEDVNPV